MTLKPGIQFRCYFLTFPCDDHLAILTQMPTQCHRPTQVPQLLAHVVMSFFLSFSAQAIVSLPNCFCDYRDLTSPSTWSHHIQ